MTSAFWAPQTMPSEPDRFRLTVTEQISVGPPDSLYLMGGVAMAAAVEALENVLDKPLRWATIQFVSSSPIGQNVEIHVEKLGGGRNIIQAQARLATDGQLTQVVSASLGQRSGHTEGQFPQMPVVQAPTDCPTKTDDVWAGRPNLMAQFDRRTAQVDEGQGTECMWIRSIDAAPVSAALLALVSDFILGAHSVTRGGTSLDNTLRIHQLVPSDWILCVTQLSGIASGAASGTMFLFSQDGVLLATASQTGLLPKGPSV